MVSRSRCSEEFKAEWAGKMDRVWAEVQANENLAVDEPLEGKSYVFRAHMADFVPVTPETAAEHEVFMAALGAHMGWGTKE